MIHPTDTVASKLPGITARVVAPQEGGAYLAVEAAGGTVLRALNSSIWGGGFTAGATAIVNRQVDQTYSCHDPAEEMRAFLSGRGFAPDRSCGMLTAAYVADAGTCAITDEQASLQVWATAGLSNISRAGIALPDGGLYPRWTARFGGICAGRRGCGCCRRWPCPNIRWGPNDFTYR
ncbi:adenosylcobinamide amidohydrolase [Paenibacillus thermoaerophilus]|uniref:Adenosylcobinamide amidohydrolase n=1 Tax=Paenibacillus thermoaerophilus TaxID=1215385 RepID=A0ABW2V2R8_9BACL|nr:adenosylcobinamide amidohydrolase [Paenibacillus thermoaerophilus]TMV13877.1 hypothetical protein FE781_11820 [Paenibacillus thermoaerophilus]